MTLNLYFSDASCIPTSPASIRDAQPANFIVPPSCPVILDDKFWPLQPWNDFLRQYSQHVSLNTARAYGRDLFCFAKFLDERALSYATVSNDDFVSYRNERFSNGLSPRSWQREVVIIRSFFNYLVRKGYLADTPWDQVGQHSVLRPRNKTYEMSVRALTKERWNSFKRVGLGGETMEGVPDPSFRGRHPLRDTSAAELAITTGMRLQEWRSLLTIDFQPLSSGGQSIILEATAKGSRRRTVYVPKSTCNEIEFYQRTERESIVAQSQKSLTRNIDRLAKVRNFEPSSGIVTYNLEGTQYRTKCHAIPLSHRSILVVQEENQVRPLSLFLGTNGKPPSQRAWHSTFAKANQRVWEAEELPEFSRTPVVPHDLRHTFAVVLLKNLQRTALDGLTQRPFGSGSISEHIISNPLLTVQRLLGHASPATTMEYLRFIEDADALVQRAFEEWDDASKDYADYIFSLLSTEKNPT